MTTEIRDAHRRSVLGPNRADLAVGRTSSVSSALPGRDRSRPGGSVLLTRRQRFEFGGRLNRHHRLDRFISLDGVAGVLRG